MTRTLLYELQASDELLERLDWICIATGLSRGEALKAGLILLERLVNADWEGKEFTFVDKKLPTPQTQRLTEPLSISKQ